MTPRTVVFALQQDATVQEVMNAHPTIAFSRIPVYAANRDEVTGFVLRTDILLNQYRNDGQAKLRDLKREIRGVHERTPLSRVLDGLLDRRGHILLVVDDHGGMEGIVTLEDVVETLIGIEIVDESDTIDDMRRLARQKWEARMKRIGIDVEGPDSFEATEDEAP
jgi:CBS domain containing-hemolysin-like protein